eukprot:TRINITY_DN16356_c0_g1_i3.p1 TRINITY_DN16356_c0_g1~~TRINITY_DN16356_c0_g1_i3.p1  ORF type:complete len:418 (+),score=85.94 TRINITY_DN16356_c0_g1_i3:163-1416(+)
MRLAAAPCFWLLLLVPTLDVGLARRLADEDYDYQEERDLSSEDYGGLLQLRRSDAGGGGEDDGGEDAAEPPSDAEFQMERAMPPGWKPPETDRSSSSSSSSAGKRLEPQGKTASAGLEGKRMAPERPAAQSVDQRAEPPALMEQEAAPSPSAVEEEDVVETTTRTQMPKATVAETSAEVATLRRLPPEGGLPPPPPPPPGRRLCLLEVPSAAAVAAAVAAPGSPWPTGRCSGQALAGLRLSSERPQLDCRHRPRIAPAPRQQLDGGVVMAPCRAACPGPKSRLRGGTPQAATRARCQVPVLRRPCRSAAVLAAPAAAAASMRPSTCSSTWVTTKMLQGWRLPRQVAMSTLPCGSCWRMRGPIPRTEPASGSSRETLAGRPSTWKPRRSCARPWRRAAREQWKSSVPAAGITSWTSTP